MSPDEQAMRYVVGSYRVLRDKTYRVGYVPYFKAGALIRESNEANKASQTGPTTLYAEIFPAIQRALAAEPRLERRIAALRCVEALRMYAAAHDGQLPESLDAIQSVPIPENPLTGAPFVYSVSGSTATLSAPPIEGIENSRLEYQVNIQK
jgi:hypothetical protein